MRYTYIEKQKDPKEVDDQPYEAGHEDEPHEEDAAAGGHQGGQGAPQQAAQIQEGLGGYVQLIDKLIILNYSILLRL